MPIQRAKRYIFEIRLHVIAGLYQASLRSSFKSSPEVKRISCISTSCGLSRMQTETQLTPSAGLRRSWSGASHTCCSKIRVAMSPRSRFVACTMAVFLIPSPSNGSKARCTRRNCKRSLKELTHRSELPVNIRTGSYPNLVVQL